jgi:uncharacterized LabA/DUF88 family protein
LTETRLKIAVFVDFDNIEIGVKTTLNQQFDISVILEAIKERGEVVTKVAYGDWKRAGDHGRLLSQHAIRLVQRNLTPGGDKNGADINLALDALEMAFTHHHINAFVIVGGDSDFITLVEKLKQYDKKVFVVGGRQFTSLVMQRNCHEFIAYENLVSRGRSGSPAERRSGVAASSDIARALPLVKRALKVLVDREVTPQLGLLKSTLLQLDSTFSEREYGVSTFRDFIEKVAQTGTVTLRSAGRSLLVDLADSNGSTLVEPADRPEPAPRPADGNGDADVQEAAVVQGASSPTDGRGAASGSGGAPSAAPGAVPDAAQVHQAVEYTQALFARAPQAPRWPMYVRQVKQYLRGIDEGFDERRLGFPNIVDYLRACQRENVVRLERDRQGGLRVFPGTALARPAPAVAAQPTDAAPPTPIDAEIEGDAVADGSAEGADALEVTVHQDDGLSMFQPPTMDERVSEPSSLEVDDDNVGNRIDSPAGEPSGGRRPRARKAAVPRARKAPVKRVATAAAGAPRSRKKATPQS